MQIQRTIAALFLLLGVAAADASARDLALTIYPAYGNPAFAIVEGRLAAAHHSSEAQSGDGKWTNLRRNAKLLRNHEREGARIQLSVAGRLFNAVTDEEGYFRKVIAGADLPLGWQTVKAEFNGKSAEGGLLVPPPGNNLGVISDLDDTLMVSEVNRKKRLLSNTFLRNPLQRQAVPGAADFIRSVASRNPKPETAPIIYLSASPRQIQGNIELFLKHNGFPEGVLLTKRVTNDRTSDPLTDQVAYKTARIEEIFARMPQVRFVLMGDDGEYDPEIYHRIRQRFPERVDQVLIRRVHPDPQRKRYEGQLDYAQTIATLSIGHQK